MSRHRPGSFLAAAQAVLADAGEPLHYREITRRALDRELVSTRGATPEATLNAQLATSLKKHEDDSPFVRTSPGVFGLREWLDKGEIELEEEGRVYIPHFPIYAGTRAVLPAWEGLSPSAITGMRAAVMALRGNPQEPVDWTQPDEWIPARLEGEAREVALRTWKGSGKRVNPRYTVGNWALVNHYRLLETGSDGLLRLTAQGNDFVEHEAGETVRQIDNMEGLTRILELIAEMGPASRADLLDPWEDLLSEDGRVRAQSSMRGMLSERLKNLLERGFIERNERSYSVTELGLGYLQMSVAATGEPDLPQEIRKLLRQQKDRVRESLREFLAEMDPYAFEHLIKRLLDEMGYFDVEVTAPARDHGVDVVGKIELGITSVQEVIQAKRQRSNVQRPVLDALRGALHRWGAVRGTIITTGNFSKGTRNAAFEGGAAPITLIDGDKLLDLLIQHDLGVRKRKAELWELDADNLLAGLEEDES